MEVFWFVWLLFVPVQCYPVYFGPVFSPFDFKILILPSNHERGVE